MVLTVFKILIDLLLILRRAKFLSFILYFTECIFINYELYDKYGFIFLNSLYIVKFLNIFIRVIVFLYHANFGKFIVLFFVM